MTLGTEKGETNNNIFNIKLSLDDMTRLDTLYFHFRLPTLK